VLGELVKAVPERALEAEMAAHLGYGKSERGGGAGNARNGTAFKTVQTGVRPVPLQVPRDRRARTSRYSCRSAVPPSVAERMRTFPPVSRRADGTERGTAGRIPPFPAHYLTFGASPASAA
jgi:Transposase, Mutator family